MRVLSLLSLTVVTESVCSKLSVNELFKSVHMISEKLLAYAWFVINRFSRITVGP